MKEEKITCACNGLKCDGICRKENLHRDRKFLKQCPAASETKEKNSK